MSGIKKTSLTFTDQIWKVQKSTNDTYLGLEFREGETKKAGFAIISLKEKKLRWKTSFTSGSWLKSLAGISEKTLFIQTYPDPNFPEVSGISAMETDSGKILWENPEWRFGEILNSKIITAFTKTGITIYLSAAEGKILSKKEIESLKITVKYPNPELSIYKEEEVHFSEIRNLLLPKGLNPVHLVEYAEIKQYAVISFYQWEDKYLKNKLIIVNNKGEILEQNTLDEKVFKPGLETFLLLKDQIVFVRDKKEIVILDL